MLSLRPSLIGYGAAGGLVLGALMWLVLGKGAAAAERIEDLQSRLDAIHAPAPTLRASIDAANLASAPIFAMTTGPGAVTEPAVALQGIARTPGHSAALVSIDGKPADWLSEGATRDGVTLQEVRASSILIDTVTGTKELALGQKIGPAAPAPGASAQSQPPGQGAPPGFRSPPAPASAPAGG